MNQNPATDALDSVGKLAAERKRSAALAEALRGILACKHYAYIDGDVALPSREFAALLEKAQALLAEVEETP